MLLIFLSERVEPRVVLHSVFFCYICPGSQSKDQTLPIGSRESFIGIILKNHSVFGLGLPGYIYIYIHFTYVSFDEFVQLMLFVHIIVLEPGQGLSKTSPFAASF